MAVPDVLEDMYHLGIKLTMGCSCPLVVLHHIKERLGRSQGRKGGPPLNTPYLARANWKGGPLLNTPYLARDGRVSSNT